MGNFLSWYNTGIQNNPVVYKGITSALLYGLGDFLSQCIEGTIKKGLQCLRLLRMILWGAIFGIVVHFWYMLLALIKIDNQYVLGFVKMVIDQATMSPFMNALMYVFLSLLETCKDQPKTAWNCMVKVIWPTLKVGYSLWPIVQIINFCFVPIDYQLFVVNVVSIFWTTFLSFQANLKNRKKELVTEEKQVDVEMNPTKHEEEKQESTSVSLTTETAAKTVEESAESANVATTTDNTTVESENGSVVTTSQTTSTQ